MRYLLHGGGVPGDRRGGGSKNPAWTRITERVLGVRVVKPVSGDAAYSAAILARHGVYDE